MRVLGNTLLLGSAATLAMMSVASAADFPMKAKAPAVQYVKICTLYGAGFYYIPGTDTCLKIGGYIRTQLEHNSGDGGIASGSNAANGAGLFNRVDSNDLNYRVRAVVTFDTRTQGEYGTLRSYYRVGWASQTPGGTASGTSAQQAYWDRAFIQFAGFTVGKAQSFFDIFGYGGKYNYINVRTDGSTGAAGLMMWAYTAQFGNGFSASIGLDDPRGHGFFGVRDLGAAAGGFGAADNGLANQGCTGAPNCGFSVPDIVGNLRVDQKWGYVGVSGALHQVAGGYYGSPNFEGAGHPGDEWGYAFGIGGELNIPGFPGDSAGVNFVYAHGAPGYAVGANNWRLISDGKIGVATGVDAVFATGGQLQLTDAWSVNAAYQHNWTRELKTSLYGGYAAVNYSGAAKTLICGGACGALTPDYAFYQIGSRTQWAPWKGQLNIGVDVFYTALQTARPALTAAGPGANGARPIGDVDEVSVIFRVQRNWYP